MLKKLQALKAKKGFTLVELIVVIAIIAVLAAILVPTLLNQVTNSRITSADSTASTIKDTINAWIVQQNANDGYLFPDSGNSGYTGSKTAISASGVDSSKTASLLAALNDAYDFTDTDQFIFIVEKNKVKAVAYCSNSAPSVTWNGSSWNDGGEVEVSGKTIIVGTYPKVKT